MKNRVELGVVEKMVDQFEVYTNFFTASTGIDALVHHREEVIKCIDRDESANGGNYIVDSLLSDVP